MRLSARDGLVVVVPRGFDESRIPGLVDGRQDWIERHQRRLEEQGKFLTPEPSGGPPERILLRVIGEEWGADYRETASRTVTSVERPGQRLLVYGNVEDERATLVAICRWLSRKAHQHLVPWLERLASERTLKVTGITPGLSVSNGPEMGLNLAGNPLQLAGGTAGQVISLDLCVFNKLAEKSGKPFDCCKTTVTVKIPGQACEKKQ